MRRGDEKCFCDHVLLIRSLKDVYDHFNKKDSLNKILIAIFVIEVVLFFLLCNQVGWKGDDENDLLTTRAEVKAKEIFILKLVHVNEVYRLFGRVLLLEY
jgi:hypothetical protein